MTTKVLFPNKEITLNGTRLRPDRLELTHNAEHIRSTICDFGDGAIFEHSQYNRFSSKLEYTTIMIDTENPVIDFKILSPSIYIDSFPVRAEFIGGGKEKLG
jgi:hypothetical protein